MAPAAAVQAGRAMATSRAMFRTARKAATTAAAARTRSRRSIRRPSTTIAAVETARRANGQRPGSWRFGAIHSTIGLAFTVALVATA